MLLEYREHETGTQPRIRVWTKEDADYGSFNVLDYKDAQTLVRIARLMGWTMRPAADEHMDPIEEA